MAATKPSRHTLLRALHGDLHTCYSILNMNEEWKILALAIKKFNGEPKFFEDDMLVKISLSPNPSESVIKSMYEDMRTVGYLLELLEDLNLLRAANTIRDFLGEILVPVTPRDTHGTPDENHSDVASSSREELEVADAIPRLPVFNIGKVVPVPYDILYRKTGEFQRVALEQHGHWVGEGGFSDVYCVDGCDGQKLAIKRLCQDNDLASKLLHAETTIPMRLQHANIQPVLGYSIDGPNTCIVYKFAPLGSPRDRLTCQNNDLPIPFHHRISIAKQTAEAIQYLHENHVIHRDVKCANILLDHGYVAMLGDFGLAKYKPELDNAETSCVSQVLGTAAYIAPESLSMITSKQDIYAYGVVLLAILRGLSTCDDGRKIAEQDLVAESCDDITKLLDWSAGEWPERLAQNMYNVAQICLTHDHHERPTMDEVIGDIRGWATYTDVKGTSSTDC